MYDFNTPQNDYIIGPGNAAKMGNPALTGIETHRTPGQEFHFDYSIEYALTKEFRAGVTGYFYQQTTNDYTAYGSIPNDKGRVFAVGPDSGIPTKNGSSKHMLTSKRRLEIGPRG